jgi:hypothetical protein
MKRCLLAVALCLAATGCILDEPETASSTAAVYSLSSTTIDHATNHANHGAYVNGRTISWKWGNWTASSSGEQTTCTYNWHCYAEPHENQWYNTRPFYTCPSSWNEANVGTFNKSLYEADYYAGYPFGACNSSAWGQRFAGYLFYGGGLPGYRRSGYEPALNASGFTTWGFHPYWCVRYKGAVRTYHGWSYTNHCGSSYTINAP